MEYLLVRREGGFSPYVAKICKILSGMLVAGIKGKYRGKILKNDWTRLNGRVLMEIKRSYPGIMCERP